MILKPGHWIKIDIYDCITSSVSIKMHWLEHHSKSWTLPLVNLVLSEHENNEVLWSVLKHMFFQLTILILSYIDLKRERKRESKREHCLSISYYIYQNRELSSLTAAKAVMVLNRSLCWTTWSVPCHLLTKLIYRQFSNHWR